ncbi:hypothetical protein ACNF42_00230 [Cuniculiplasma sp. SKW3]|uniref:hypothetical protein n=1 Tax=unclassified Cuniculiplasma TaxID=2619706 RepID=UPI003FD25F00
MSGTLNDGNEIYSTNFKDSNCSVTIKKVDEFVALINIEETSIGKSTPHADLALIFKKGKRKIIIFELKGVDSLKEKEKYEILMKRIKNKLIPTVNLFLEDTGKGGKRESNKVAQLNGHSVFEYVIVVKNESIRQQFVGILIEKKINLNLSGKQFGVPINFHLEKEDYYPS